MSQGFIDSDSFMRIFFEHFLQQTKSIGVKSFVLLSLKSDIAGPVLSQHFVVGLAREGAGAKQQNMEDESQTEHIANGVILSLHVLDVDDLGGNVARGSASHEQILIDIRELRQPEVGNHTLKAALCPEKDVLGFEVSVHDLLVVHLPESEENGVHDSFGFLGFEFVLGLDLVVELTSFQQFHHNVERILRLKYFVKFHTVLLIQSPHYFNFFDEALLSLVFTIGCLLRKGLYCVAFAHLELLGQIDRSEVSLSDFLLRFELFVESPLVDLSLEDLSTSFKIGLRSQPILDLLFLLLHGESQGRCREGEFEIKIKWHNLLFLGSSLDETIFIQLQSSVPFGSVLHLQSVKQFA